MTWLHQAFVAPLSEVYFQKALLGGSIIAVVCGVVGCLVILRRMSFLGDALSHAMIAGVAAGYLFMKVFFGIEAYAPAMLVGSVIAAIVTVGLIGFVARVSRIKEDAAIGIMYCGVFAAGVVLVSVYDNYIHIDLMHFIMGDILGVADHDLWVSAVVAAVVLTVVVLFFRTLQLTSFDPVMAASIGIPVVLVDYVLTACVSLVVVSAVNMVGVILVVGFLITPAATAYLLSDRLQRMMALAALFGVTSVVGGLYLCVWLDSAGGGAVVLFCTLQFIVVLTVAPRYGLIAGWLRRRRMVPQQLLENVLVAMARARGTALAATELLAFVDVSRRRLERALATMVEDGHLQCGTDGYTLTAVGAREATRIWRAHRIWESYLSHVGMEADAIHAKAHQLEHVHDTAVLDYLDELLGHPVRDPHGNEIPADPTTTATGAVVALSRLRAGQHGVVTDTGIAEGGLTVGEAVEMAPRCDDGHTWVARRADGTEVMLAHTVADTVRIRLAGE